MFFSLASITLLVCALLVCATLLILRQRGLVGGRTEAGVLAVLVPAAFVAHLGVLHSDPEHTLTLRAPPPHLHEIFHYYLGTKYFAELGYTGLYEATVLADAEDAPEHFVPEAAARDLTDNRLVDRATLLAASGRTRAAFDAERWAAFKRDLALLREVHPAEFWNTRGYTIDHGYNATPFVTALLGVIANQPFVDTGTFFGSIRVLDPYLLALVGVVVGALEGAVAGLYFLFFLFANPMNEYAFIGGAYLRYNHLIALALALIALRQRWLVASGICFAIAGWLRVFPLVFPALLLLRDLAGPGWRARLRRHAPLHTAFAVASLLIVAASSWIATPDGGNPWRAFAETISLHAASPTANRVALEVPFSYAPGKDRHREALGTGDEWVRETRRRLDERWLPFRIAQLLLALSALLVVRRGQPEEVLLPGLLLLFALSPLSHYYWGMLGLIPLVARDPRRLLLLSLLLLALALTALPGFFFDSLDLRFTLYSLEILAFLLVVLVPPRSARHSIVLAAAVCLWACTPADDPAAEGGEAPPAPPPVHARPPTGDSYETTALGFSISKPPEWVFRPETSLPVDAERTDKRPGLWKLLDRPGEIPVVTLAAPGAGDAGPLVRIRAIPIRAEDTGWGIDFLTEPAPEKFVRNAQNPPWRQRDLVIVEDATPLQISGHDAGRMVLAYVLPGDGDDSDDASTARRVEERIFHLRRGMLFFWIEMLAPEPVDAALVEDFDRILASLRVDP